MDLSLSDEQTLLSEAASRFALERYTPTRRSAAIASERGYSAQIWREFADLGWLGLAIAEEHGGLGLGAIETGIVTEALGRALVIEPYLATAVISAALIEQLGTSAQKREWLGGISQGKLIVALAHSEPQARNVLSDIAVKATRVGKGWRLSGRKSLVCGGAWADLLLVSARIFGERNVSEGIGVFAIRPDANGMALTSYQMLDGSRASNIAFNDVAAGQDDLLGGSDDALSAIEAAVDRGLVAMAFEAAGCMDVLLASTIAYTRTRVQFGRALAANQVVRHRLVDMKIHLEMTKASALHAALLIDDGGSPDERGRGASGAKVKAGRAGQFVGEQAVQLHGGMGVTDELAIGAYYKRLMAIRTLFGTPEFHLQRHARLSRGVTAKAAS